MIDTCAGHGPHTHATPLATPGPATDALRTRVTQPCNNYTRPVIELKTWVIRLKCTASQTARERGIATTAVARSTHDELQTRATEPHDTGIPDSYGVHCII